MLTRRRTARSYGALAVGALVVVTFGVNGGWGRSPSIINVGRNPVAIAITPNGASAYVVNATSNTVTPIDLASGGTASAIAVRPRPATRLPLPFLSASAARRSLCRR
jgi:hypothetical protein